MTAVDRYGLLRTFLDAGYGLRPLGMPCSSLGPEPPHKKGTGRKKRWATPPDPDRQPLTFQLGLSDWR